MDPQEDSNTGWQLFRHSDNLLLYAQDFQKQDEDAKERSNRKPKKYLFLSGIVESYLFVQKGLYTVLKPKCYVLQCSGFSDQQNVQNLLSMF